MENSTIKISAGMIREAVLAKIVQEAICLINGAAERMLSELKYSVPIIKSGENPYFERGIRTPEVREALMDAGFTVKRSPLDGEDFFWLATTP